MNRALMKKEMSSFDVRSIVTELASVEGAHMDKIFHWGSGNVLFRLNVTGQGKKELFFKGSKWLYCPAVKPETPTMPSAFASYLRKYIDNARIGKVTQTGFDRVVEMELFKSDGEYKLIFEMFGGGNVLLLKDGIIQNCLVQKTWSNRSVRPGFEYLPPKSRFDPTVSTLEDFITSFRSSDADCVRTLATSVNLGGQYAEEICTRIGIDKSTLAADVDDDTVVRMYETMRDMVDKVIAIPEPTAFLKDGKIEDFAPMNMMCHGDLEAKRYDSMSELIHAFMLEVADAEEEAFVDPAVVKLNRRIAKQEETLEEYRVAEEEFRKMAEALYRINFKLSGGKPRVMNFLRPVLGRLVPKLYYQQDFWEQMNYESIGGTPVIGINAPVMIGHGGSSARAISSMILSMEREIKGKFPEKLRAALAEK